MYLLGLRHNGNLSAWQAIANTVITLNLEPHGPHQLQGVAPRDHTLAQAIVESDFAALQLILEVDVGRAAAEAGDDFGQRQIVRGHQAYGPAIYQTADDRLRADAAVVRVCSAEQLVEQK